MPLIAGAVVVVLLLGWYVGAWRPAETKSKQAVASKAAAQVLHAKLAGQIAGLETLTKTLPGEEAKLRQDKIEVPATASVATVIDQISAIAVSDHIVWSSESQALSAASSSTATTTTVAGTSGSGDSSLALTLDVVGKYLAMTKFITDLENRPRLIVIDTLSYAPGTGGVVTLTMAARAFYNPTPDPTISTITSAP